MRDEKDFSAPEQDEESGEIIIMKVIQVDGEEQLSLCDSDEELEAAYAVFMDELFEDEDDSQGEDSEPIFVSITSEDGEDFTLEFISSFEMDGVEYRAFFPTEEE